MTPAQVAAKIAKFKAKQEATLKKYPVGPMANSARINLNKAEAALASLQETNEGMRIGKQPQAQMEAPMPNDMDYMQARYGGYTKPEYAEGGPTEGSSIDIAQFEESMKTILEAEFTENPFSAENELSDLMEYAKNHPDELDSIVAEALKGNIPTVNVGHSGAEPELLFERPYYERFPDEAPADWENPFPPAVEESIEEEVEREPFESLERLESSPATQIDSILDPDKGLQQSLPIPLPSSSQENQGFQAQYDPFVPPPQALYDQIKEDGKNATIYGNNPSILSAENNVIPEEATMTASGLARGYLGNTYINESTNPNVSTRILPNQAEKDEAAKKLLKEFNALPKAEQSKIRVNAFMDNASPDFTYEEIMQWGRDNYGVSEGRANSRNEPGIDNMIIGANVYAKDKGHVIYNTTPDAGYGISVDATRVLLQSLVNNGLSKEQALEALKDPDIYKNIKSNASPNKLGYRSIDDLKNTVDNADTWARTTSNREQLHSFLIPEGPREDGEVIEGDFATELAPGVNAEISGYDARVQDDKDWWLRAGAGRYLPSWMYIDGAGGRMDDVVTTGDRKGEQVGARARGIEQDRAADPNTYNVLPSFIGGDVGQTEVLNDDVIPEIVEDKKEDKKKDKEKGTEEKKQWNPETKTWETKGPDTYDLDMGNPSALMAIPGLAALASARIQGRALENMQGPPKPITTMMPQFNYKSNIGQQLQEVKDASNAVMQNTNLQGQQAAALNQQVMAQRLKSNSGLLQQDSQQEQAARARYDAMSTQVRMTNDALRNSYLQDSTNFKNKKEMLQTSARQQPLNVLASSAQDYLANVYKSNLAAQMEAVGRPYDTGYDAEGNWIGYKNKD